MIIRTPDRDRYLVVSKQPIEDDLLSWKARGLLLYLLSKPDHWVVLTAHLVEAAPTGRTAVLAGLRELEGAGYIVRSQGRTGGGHWDSRQTIVYESPQVETANGLSVYGSTGDGFPVSGKSTTSELLIQVSTEGSELPAPASPPPVLRRVDPLFDAVVAVCGINPSELTPKARAPLNGALAEIRAVGATRDEVHHRAAVYRRMYRHHNTLTPTALAKHWPQLGVRQPRDVVDEVFDIAQEAGR